jgi:hypothetical protein
MSPRASRRWACWYLSSASSGRYGSAWRRSRQPASGYKALKQAFGSALLLSVEIFVAADLVRTVVIAPTLDNVLVLGLLVLIRTFLSFSLETEIEGVPPWRRATTSGAGTSRPALTTTPGDDAR